VNPGIVGKYLGQFLLALAVLMAPAAGWAGWYAEWDALGAFLTSMALVAGCGGLLMLLGRHAKNVLYQREALGLVGIGWLLAAGAGALPFFFSGVMGPVDAYFEAMSGFTTTGATVLADIEGADRSILFWRSFTHWLGGMGIIVLFIAVLPYLGAGGKQLFRSETPGPDPRGLRPRIRDTASILWKIYLSFTAAQTLLLMATGMSLFEALCQTFGTLATGGFSTRQASIAGFNSISAEIIIILFMVLAGTNFSLYFAMMRGDWRAPFRSTEWRVYIGLFAVATAFIAVNLVATAVPPEANNLADDAEVLQTGPPYGAAHALRVAAFQVVAIMTTTGFCTDNFDIWPDFSRMLLVVLMFIGGCAGSTGGGMKVIRLVMLAKMVYWRIESTFRPKTIRIIRINGAVIDNDIQRMVYAFFVLYIAIFAIASLCMTAIGLPFTTAATSVAATLNNIGPGLELVGATADYSHIPDIGKLLLSVCMVMGRLELFSICVLFLPAFWKHS